MSIIVRVKRGTDAQRLGYTPLLGEIVYAEDTKEAYIGDGVQLGGIPFGGNYVKTTQGNVAGGYAALDATGKISATVLPPLAVNNVKPVADIAARDALVGMEEGDVAIVDDADGAGSSASFIKDAGGTWLEMKTPTDKVASVNGKTGIVTIAMGDMTDVDNTPATAGQVMIWDAVASKWKASTLPAGVTKFFNLTDVGNPATNQGKLLGINAAGDGVEYHDVLDGGVF